MMPLKKVARVVSGKPDRRVHDEPVRGVSIDSRTIQAGDVFFALHGERSNGHLHVEEAFQRGACAAIVEEPVPAAGVTIRVPSTMKALWSLARSHRRSLKGRVVAVTGSNGKTTTKGMIAHIMGGRTVCAQSSFNNSIGVPLSILAAPEDAPHVVLELGTNSPGEIAKLATLARPEVAVITNVGPSHLEGLGSVDGVATEKISILGALGRWGLGVIPEDPRLLWRVPVPTEQIFTFGSRAKADLHPSSVGPGMQFVVRGVDFELDMIGKWNLLNALAATSVCLSWGVSLKQCARRLRTFQGPRMRMEKLDFGGVTVINDAYNSNPASASLAIKELEKMTPDGRRVAVIGEMGELGEIEESEHRKLGRILYDSNIQVVVGIGPLCEPMMREIRGKTTWMFEDIEAARKQISLIVRNGDVVLLKGSRLNALERLLPWIKVRRLTC